MQCVKNRNFVDQRAAGECRPVKCVCVNQVKLGTAPAQAQEQFKEKGGLSEETGISRGFVRWFSEVGGAYALGYGDWFDAHAGNRRIIPGKERHRVSASHQPLREIGQERLRSTRERLSDSRHQRGYERNSHSSPR